MRSTTRPSRPSASRSSRTFVVAVFAVAAGAMGCGSNGPPPAPIVQDGPLAGAPAWVVQSCRDYWDDAGDGRLCGVGSVAGTRNLSLARTAAIGLARTEIKRSLEARLRTMLTDYAASPDVDPAFGSSADDPQYVDDVAKQIAQLSLGATKLEDSWVGPDGTLYTLVELDLKGFEDALDQMTSLSDPIRQAVRERAESGFREPPAPTD